MEPKTEKRMEAFIGRLPRSLEGNVTASKPQTFEEAINIAQSLIIKTSSTTTTPMIATTTIKKTTTIATITMINTSSRIGSKKPSRLMLPPMGHLTKNCRNKRPIIGNNLRLVPGTCSAYGEKGHYANHYLKANNKATGKHT
nr:reverse transcriptase domain-containing protein [Tanacetum cinerariifolium]